MRQLQVVHLEVLSPLLIHPKAMVTTTELGTRRDDPLTSESARRTITGLFAQSPFHELRQIRVDVTQEQILLSGSVASYYIKQVAQETARQACCFRKIRNKITVF